MVSFAPSAGDEFYLCMLLTRVKGSVSYDDLKTFDGEVHGSCKEACIARGMLEDDIEWEGCLMEAATWKSPRALRKLFGTILTDCQPTNPKQLYEMFKDHMIEDIVRRNNMQGFDSEEECKEKSENELLCYLDYKLEDFNKTTEYFNLPKADHSVLDITTIADYMETNVEESTEDSFDDWYMKLNPEQKTIMDIVKTKIDNNKGGMIFLDAPGGTGKTFLLNLIMSYVRKQGKIALASAGSGIAASLLYEGTPSHTRFGYPLEVTSTSSCSVTPISIKGKELIAAHVIRYDEAPIRRKEHL
jgi:hypothetical protein